MRKITKNQALTWTRDLWKWVKKNYTLYREYGIYVVKARWPGWKVVRACECFCPLCEFTCEHYFGKGFRIYDKCAEVCLLTNVWHGGCQSSSSPYGLLSEGKSTEEEFMRCCDQIIQGAEELIAQQKG